MVLFRTRGHSRRLVATLPGIVKRFSIPPVVEPDDLPSLQTPAVVDGLLSGFTGLSGEYVAAFLSEDAETGHRQLKFRVVAQGQIEPALQELTQRMLPIWCAGSGMVGRRPSLVDANGSGRVADDGHQEARLLLLEAACTLLFAQKPTALLTAPRSEYVAVIQRYTETRDCPRWGLVAQGLAGALRGLLQDWHVMVAQLEHQLHAGKLTLQVGRLIWERGVAGFVINMVPCILRSIQLPISS